MASQQSVLIVDRSAENREVLQMALARRGMRAISAGRVESGLELARSHDPDLIVLDLETVDAASEKTPAPSFCQAGGRRTPLLMLGTVRSRVAAELGGEFVSKPYHYGPLIRKIEALLGASGQSGVRGE